MINRKEVQRVAKLARIGITQKEEEKFSRELSLILDYVEKLKEVDISKTPPTSHSVGIKNITREDSKSEKLKTELPFMKAKVEKKTKPSLTIKNEKLLKLAPETKNGYLKVKSIL